MWCPEQRGEDLYAVEFALSGRAQDTGEHLLRRGALSGSIAAAIDLTRDHRRTKGLLGAPVRGVHRRDAKKPKEGAPLAIEMRDKALHIRHDGRPVEHARELLFELSAHDGDTVLRDRARGVAIAHRQRPLQEVVHVAGNAGVRMILLQSDKREFLVGTARVLRTLRLSEGLYENGAIIPTPDLYSTQIVGANQGTEP